MIEENKKKIIGIINNALTKPVEVENFFFVIDIVIPAIETIKITKCLSINTIFRTNSN